MLDSNQSENNIQQNFLIDALLKDRKSERRWKNFRFFVYLFLLLAFIFLVFSSKFSAETNGASIHPYVSMVRLSGVILPGSNFSAEKVVPQLQNAFEDTHAKGVVIVINSPGGSPVQASIIHDKILELKKQYHKKVIVIGEDALASGAYLVATAGDEIYVNNDTLTGSIGVIMSGFGFTDAINKLGITRRVITAGENKDRLDPFKPEDPADNAKIQMVLNEVHQSFIKDVKEGRGNRLRGDEKELFSGDFWTGSEAVNLGLADGTGNLWNVLQNQFQVKYYVDYTRKSTLMNILLGDVDSELNLGLFDHNSPLQAQLNSF